MPPPLVSVPDSSPASSSRTQAVAPKRVIRDVMTPAPYSVQQTHALAVAAKLMQDKHIRHLPVFDNRKLVGVLGEHDVARALAKEGSSTLTVAVALQSAPLVTAPDESVLTVVRRMVTARADLAFVVDRERLIGVFTTIDALKVLAHCLEDEAKGNSP